MSRKRETIKKEHEREQPKDKSVPGKSAGISRNLWVYTTAILAVLLAASVSANMNGNSQATGLPDSVVSEKVLSYINTNLVDSGAKATLVKATDISGVIKLKLDVSGQEFESYATKDGTLLFASAISLDEAPAREQPPSQNTESGSVPVSADDDPSIGPEDAPVQIIEFSDFQCPFCARAAPTVKQIIEEYGDQVRVVYRDFPLSIHNNAQKAAEAAECADDQGKFWEMHDRMFGNQGALDTNSLKQYASDLGLDTSEFDTCLETGKHADEVHKDFADGQKAGVTGTPAFFVNGKLVSGAQPLSVFEQLINSELGV